MEDLFAKIRAGDVNSVKVALEANPKLASMRDEGSSFSALHFAASVGQQEIVSLLLGMQTCDPEALTLGGQTFAQIAKKKGFHSIVELAESRKKAPVKDVHVVDSGKKLLPVSQAPSPSCSGLVCSICGSDSNISRCGRCKSRFYCSTDHQREDWAVRGHRFLCGKSNQRFVLARRPANVAELDSSLFRKEDIPVDLSAEIVVRNLFLSVDPYMRGRLHERPSYAAPQALNAVMLGETVGEVVYSMVSFVQTGSIVRVASGGWQSFTCCKATDVEVLDPGVAPEVHLSGLGMPAVTAWHMLKLLEVDKGDVVLVSAASGAVGHIAVQLAKLKGAKVVGLAGTDTKCEKLRSINVDAAINYSSLSKDALANRIMEAVGGANVTAVCDNVGGSILAACMLACASKARIAVCGIISRWETDGQSLIDSSLILTKQLRVEGFIVPLSSFEPARTELSDLLKSKKLVSWESIVEGFDEIPNAFLSLFAKGSNHVGKLLVKM